MNTYRLFLFLVNIFSVTLSESCPDGWIDSLELGCLYFGSDSESSTWLGASSYCEELHPNSSMIEIFSPEENNLLSLIAALEMQVTGADAWWIGLDDIGHEGQWVWQSSSTPASFFSWADDKPNSDPVNRDDCVYMSPHPLSDDLVWTDTSCDNEDNEMKIAPLCQMQPETSTTLTSTTTTTERGLLVAGGYSSSALDVMEIINMETMSSCTVDTILDQPRSSHTGDGNLVCGGQDDDGYSISSCYNVATGETINLLNGRDTHTSWSTDAGIYLLGGWDSNDRTTELITGDTTQAGFGLQYSTFEACGIADEDDGFYIITGGYDTPTTVSKYSQSGWIEDLPSLNTGRRDHGCGTYIDSNNQRIYLVTGGRYNSNYHSSTEQLVKGGTEWILTKNSLPAEVIEGLRGISFNNQIMTTGGCDEDACDYSDKILMFNKETGRFEEIGKLVQGRSYHSMSVVNINDYNCM